MKKLYLLLVLVFFMANGLSVNAGGPLVVKNGMAITYGSRPLLYRYDLGPLGMFNNTDARILFEDRFMDWVNVSTATNSFKRDNPDSLSFDVTANNFDAVLNAKDLLGYTPVVFDNDGSLLNAFLGNGAGNSVLGLSGPITVNSGQLANQIAESQAVFNGRFVDGIDTPTNPESTTDSFKGTIIHEFGHGQGLDHAQINVEAIKPASSQTIRDAVPLMFPVAVNDLFLIRRDDASAISSLYPNQNTIGDFGTIEGTLFRQDGTTPVLGGNIIARNINNSTLEAISCVSDYLTQGDGFYKLFTIPPGQYTIEIEPIDLSFTGGSGVGPYTASKTDKSFQNPVPKGFYTGPNKPITTDQSQALIITVAAGQAIKNVNIIASQTVTSTSSSTSSSSSSGSTTSISSSSSSSTSGSLSNEINETEPNNLISQAQTITPPVTISRNAAKADSGELELSSDNGSVVVSDLFKFTFTEPDVINALLTFSDGSSDSDLDLILFNYDGSEIIDSSSQNGRTDELISTSLQTGTYLLGVGAFAGSASYKLSITKLGNTTPSIAISGPSTIVLNPQGMNNFKIKADAINFNSNSMCKIIRSNPQALKFVSPSTPSFTITPTRTTKNIKLTIPFTKAKDLINSQAEEAVTVSIICSNGASDEIDVLLTPNTQPVIENQKSTRHILRIKQ